MQRKSFFARLRTQVSKVKGQDQYLRPWTAKINDFNTGLVFWILLAGLFLILAFPFIVIAAPPRSDNSPPPLVTVAPVILQDVNPPEEYVGHME
ncbi:MAG: hypothetical protein P8X68_22285, partial [Desulfobacterales bacterium]